MKKKEEYPYENWSGASETRFQEKDWFITVRNDDYTFVTYLLIDLLRLSIKSLKFRKNSFIVFLVPYILATLTGYSMENIKKLRNQIR